MSKLTLYYLQYGFFFFLRKQQLWLFLFVQVAPIRITASNQLERQFQLIWNTSLCNIHICLLSVYSEPEEQVLQPALIKGASSGRCYLNLTPIMAAMTDLLTHGKGAWLQISCVLSETISWPNKTYFISTGEGRERKREWEPSLLLIISSKYPAPFQTHKNATLQTVSHVSCVCLPKISAYVRQEFETFCPKRHQLTLTTKLYHLPLQNKHNELVFKYCDAACHLPLFSME